MLFAAGLFGLALLMVSVHRRSFERAQQRPLSAGDRAFRHRQYRRRTWASSLLAIAALCIFVGLRTPPANQPVAFLSAWIVVMLVTLAAVGLAMVDALATGLHFGRQRREQSHAWKSAMRREAEAAARDRQDA